MKNWVYVIHKRVRLKSDRLSRKYSGFISITLKLSISQAEQYLDYT